MPVDPSRSQPISSADMPETVVFGPVPDDGPSGYGDRYAEDSFDYPASASAQDWSAGAPPAPAADPADSVSAHLDTGNGGSGTGRRGGQAAARWPQGAGRRKPLLLAAAALLIAGGFGLARSMVSNTVSSSPTPGPASDLGQVSATQPVTPSAPPVSALPPADSGTGPGTSAPATSAAPVTGDRHDGEREDDGREDHRDDQREDSDRSDDG
ncbi:hypothetical protein [Streptomyces sp. Tu102]|uniref:hypothetical protein n=1 Tax=Streptomyces TaxID=1883 RepID=UPI001BDC8DFE|nr:hypothetical protein [Streptomyces sp. Tu102]MBT1093531.1 hypothetical protein [Streptomyces sp. Tu102]